MGINCESRILSLDFSFKSIHLVHGLRLMIACVAREREGRERDGGGKERERDGGGKERKIREGEKFVRITPA